MTDVSGDGDESSPKNLDKTLGLGSAIPGDRFGGPNGDELKNIQLKLGENWTLVENDVMISRVRITKPKKFTAQKNVVLPTIYHVGLIKKPAGGKKIDKPSSAGRKAPLISEALEGADAKTRFKRQNSAIGYRELELDEAKANRFNDESQPLDQKNLRAMMDDLKMWKKKIPTIKAEDMSDARKKTPEPVRPRLKPELMYLPSLEKQPTLEENNLAESRKNVDERPQRQPSPPKPWRGDNPNRSPRNKEPAEVSEKPQLMKKGSLQLKKIDSTPRKTPKAADLPSQEPKFTKPQQMPPPRIVIGAPINEITEPTEKPLLDLKKDTSWRNDYPSFMGSDGASKMETDMEDWLADMKNRRDEKVETP